MQVADRERRGAHALNVDHRVVGFISETAVIFDPASIADQKAGIDAVSKDAGLAVDAYLVEMTRVCPDDLWSPAVRSLLLRARLGTLHAVVLDHVDRLAADRGDALVAAIALAECGVRIIEAGRGTSRHASPGRPTRRLGVARRIDGATS